MNKTKNVVEREKITDQLNVVIPSEYMDYLRGVGRQTKAATGKRLTAQEMVRELIYWLMCVDPDWLKIYSEGTFREWLGSIAEERFNYE